MELMDKWFEISIHTTEEAVEAVANILNETGTSGVVIEDPEILTRDWDAQFGEIYQLSSDDYPKEGVILKGYLPESESIHDKIKEIGENIAGLMRYGIDPGTGSITVKELHEEEWSSAWKKYYKPVHVTRNLTITPTWEKYESPSDRSGEIIIELDPGMAFGTGTHPTTTLCLKALEKIIRPHHKVIDVGCGSGILSIAAAKLGASSVLALDLDEVAVKSAKMNIDLNDVEDRVRVKQNDLLNGITTGDVIVANILAEVIVKFAQEVVDHLNEDGFFIASGIISEKENLVKETLTEKGLEIKETLYEEDWVAIIAKKV